MLEFEEIKEQLAFERTEGAKSFVDLLKPGMLRHVGLGCSLQIWSQLSGMTVMMYYIIYYVFKGAGLTGWQGSLIADSIQYVLNVAFIIPAIIYIDRWGRRPLLIAGSTLMGFSLCLVGGLQGKYGECGTVNGSRVWVITNHEAVTKGIIMCSYLFICSFAVTMGPISWMYPIEIFPMKVCAKAVSLLTATNWLFNFALAWVVPPGLLTITWKTYFVFATFNFVAVMHFLFCFPKTAGRTLEEIEAVFAQGHACSAWAISRDIGKRNLEDVVGKNVKETRKNNPLEAA